jgi:hypothetical protein
MIPFILACLFCFAFLAGFLLGYFMKKVGLSETPKTFTKSIDVVKVLCERM